jgi:hypothetical protein
MRRIRGRQLAKAMLFGAIGTFLGIAINAALDYARQDWSNPVGIAAVAVLASVSGVIPLLQADRPEPAPPANRGTVYPSGAPPAVGSAPVPPPTGQGWPPPSAPGWRPPSGQGWPAPGAPAGQRRSGRVPLLAAALLLLVLCGGGAAGATYGVKFFGAWFTGDQDGVSILAAPAEGSAGPLTLTVDQMEQTRNFTRVHLVGMNSGDETPKLVAGFVQLTGDDGTTLKADPFRSDWPEDVTPGRAGVKGWLVFKGHLAAGTTNASLRFTAIFGTLGGEREIAVEGIQLRMPR